MELFGGKNKNGTVIQSENFTKGIYALHYVCFILFMFFFVAFAATVTTNKIDTRHRVVCIDSHFISVRFVTHCILCEMSKEQKKEEDKTEKNYVEND